MVSGGEPEGVSPRIGHTAIIRGLTPSGSPLATHQVSSLMETADIVVIGGGVMGASIAFQLARRRAGKVLVLEKSFLGAGSSGKSGAIIRQHYSHPLTAAMAQRGLRFFERDWLEDEMRRTHPTATVIDWQVSAGNSAD